MSVYLARYVDLVAEFLRQIALAFALVAIASAAAPTTASAAAKSEPAIYQIDPSKVIEMPRKSAGIVIFMCVMHPACKVAKLDQRHKSHEPTFAGRGKKWLWLILI
jgi:hypothetical protein